MDSVKSKLIRGMVTFTETQASENYEPYIVTHNTFYPIDLLSASLGSCITLYASITAKKNGFRIKNISTEINREMENSRVSKYDIIINIEGIYTDEQKQIISHGIENCPVANSLHQDIEKNFTYNYISEN